MLNLDVKINKFNIAFKYENGVSSHKYKDESMIPFSDKAAYHEIIDFITSTVQKNFSHRNCIDNIRDQIPSELNNLNISIIKLIKVTKPKLHTLPSVIHQMIFDYLICNEHFKFKRISKVFNRLYDANQIFQNLSDSRLRGTSNFLYLKKFKNIYKLDLLHFEHYRDDIWNFLQSDQCKNLIELRLESHSENLKKFKFCSFKFLKSLKKLKLYIFEVNYDKAYLFDEEQSIKDKSYSPFPDSLNHLTLYGYRSLSSFSLLNLNSLDLNEVFFKENEPACHFPNLKSLRLNPSNVSCTSQTLSNIQVLKISHSSTQTEKKEFNLDLINNLNEIRELQINFSKIKVPDHVISPTLEKLSIENSAINNIEFILNFPSLKELTIRAIKTDAKDFSIST